MAVIDHGGSSEAAAAAALAASRLKESAAATPVGVFRFPADAPPAHIRLTRALGVFHALCGVSIAISPALPWLFADSTDGSAGPYNLNGTDMWFLAVSLGAVIAAYGVRLAMAPGRRPWKAFRWGSLATSVALVGLAAFALVVGPGRIYAPTAAQLSQNPALGPWGNLFETYTDVGVVGHAYGDHPVVTCPDGGDCYPRGYVQLHASFAAGLYVFAIAAACALVASLRAGRDGL
jgi:hypothetical protein